MAQLTVHLSLGSHTQPRVFVTVRLRRVLFRDAEKAFIQGLAPVSLLALRLLGSYKGIQLACSMFTHTHTLSLSLSLI